MTQDKYFADLRMDATRLPSDATAVTATQSQALKDGEVLADDGASYATVQAAQDAASSWIRLPPATFTEQVSVNTEGLSIVGSGYDTVVDANGASSASLQIDASDVTITNLRVANSSGVGTIYGLPNNNNLTVDSIWCLSTSASVIWSEQPETSVYNSIIGNTNHNVSNRGIQIRECNGGHIVSANIIEVENYEGIFFYNTDDAVVSSNYVDGVNNSDSNADPCITITEDSIAYGNRTERGNRGILLDGSSVDCIVVNNRISDPRVFAIDDEGTNNLVQDNKTGSAN